MKRLALTCISHLWMASIHKCSLGEEKGRLPWGITNIGGNYHRHRHRRSRSRSRSRSRQSCIGRMLSGHPRIHSKPSSRRAKFTPLIPNLGNQVLLVMMKHAGVMYLALPSRACFRGSHLAYDHLQAGLQKKLGVQILRSVFLLGGGHHRSIYRRIPRNE